MRKITLSFEIITPLIMSGADRYDVELREQSLKGILRWWFRFYKGAELDLEELKEKESEIWGSQEVASKIKITIKNKKLSSKKNGKDYYAYLCMNDDRGDRYSRIKRRAFHENQKFSIDFYLLPPLKEKVRKELETTLFFLSNLGGLGARWRRGFGSVIIDNYHIDGKNI
ncbi:MAG: type III-B CRISPR module RAMP protein Cmr1, partial [candidate division WOR-3 bacterium]